MSFWRNELTGIRERMDVPTATDPVYTSSKVGKELTFVLGDIARTKLCFSSRFHRFPNCRILGHALSKLAWHSRA